MFDAKLRPIITPPLDLAGRFLARRGVSANAATMFGMVLGLVAAVLIGFELYWTGLAFLIANRILDGLDGAIARATRLTDLGGFLDIVADFVVYVAVPVGFGFADPDNLPFALLLVGSFTLTGTSFLAFAALAEKRGLSAPAHGRKSFFYNTGLTEGGETILAFVLMCVFPGEFAWIAGLFTLMCLITVVQRTYYAAKVFSHPEPAGENAQD